MRVSLLSLRALRLAAYLFALPVVLLLQFVYLLHRKEFLLWGPVPIINNKYWSQAVAGAGWKSKTLMAAYYAKINQRTDFDLYFSDLMPWAKRPFVQRALGPLLAHLYICKHAVVMHIPFSGGPLGQTPLWWIEALLYRFAGVKTVVLPYGADIYRYSMIPDPSIRHALLLSYPQAGRYEQATRRRVEYWVKNADVIVMGYTLEGIGRWDVPAGNMVCIDLKRWGAKTHYSDADGRDAAVRIIHSPNHRGAKGTEFLIASIEKLRERGHQIELVLLEGVQNEQVREELTRADILADQFALPGYGLAAIEGMATGLPVMANLDAESYTRVFRRYSFLDECPIVSTTPESLARNIELLVINPGLRRELGLAGRAYAEKYHSFACSQHLFGSIYRKVLHGEDVDLMNLFHPLKSEYVRSRPKIVHPLIENHLPPGSAPRC